MNTFFNILNLIKHCFYLLVALCYSMAIVAITCIAIYVSIPFVWIMFLCFLYGYFIFVGDLVDYYKKNWTNKGSFFKSLWHLLTRK